MSDPLIQPDVIPLHPAAADPVRMPDPTTVFVDRARRFDHFVGAQPAQASFFRFMAALARAQHDAAKTYAPQGLPSPAARATRREHRMPVLAAGLADHGGAWVPAIRAVLAASRARDDERELTEAARDARRRLEDASDVDLERLGSALLAYEYESVPTDATPWLAAGLQLHWVRAAAALGRAEVRPLDVSTVCPCCGSLPVASLRRIGGLEQGLRYLVCSLCTTQWHMVRIKCSHCESTAAMGYLTLSSDPDSKAGQEAATREVVKAEVCDDCASYLKLVSLESDAQAEPVADDLATLALDLLTDERGYVRVGPNLLVHPGVAPA